MKPVGGKLSLIMEFQIIFTDVFHLLDITFFLCISLMLLSSSDCNYPSGKHQMASLVILHPKFTQRFIQNESSKESLQLA